MLALRPVVRISLALIIRVAARFLRTAPLEPAPRIRPRASALARGPGFAVVTCSDVDYADGLHEILLDALSACLAPHPRSLALCLFGQQHLGQQLVLGVRLRQRL